MNPSSLLAVDESRLSEIADGSALADASLTWPDSLLIRRQVQELLETLNAELLRGNSATLTLERWCVRLALATPATVVAHRMPDEEKALPAALRGQLGITGDTVVRYRRVQLACGPYVLSEAENWYLPDRLDESMNHQLDHSNAPFGKVVRSLRYRRKTLLAKMLWFPLSREEEGQLFPLQCSENQLVIPGKLMQHQAILYDAQGHPFSALMETYLKQILGFHPKRAYLACC